MTDITESANRTFVYTDSFFQINDGTSTDKIVFIQDWNFTPSMDDFDVDRIDTGTPIFTRKSDVIGTFNFLTKNATDLYDTVAISSTDKLTATNWINQIANGVPTEITIISILTAAGDGETTHSKVTIQWTGRIMSTPLVQVRDTGVQEFEVIGEITAITKVQQTVSS